MSRDIVAYRFEGLCPDLKRYEVHNIEEGIRNPFIAVPAASSQEVDGPGGLPIGRSWERQECARSHRSGRIIAAADDYSAINDEGIRSDPRSTSAHLSRLLLNPNPPSKSLSLLNGLALA